MAKVKTKPEMRPGETSSTAMDESGESSIPTEMPPSSFAESLEVEGPEQMKIGFGDAAPSLSLEMKAAGVTAWLSNKKINALWSINQNRNSWIGVLGVGWKKLSTASDTGIASLTMVSAHALEKGSVVNCREESDGMIHEIYVW